LKKILIIGNGFLGKTISKIAKIKNFEVFEASRTKKIPIDIRKIESVENVIKKKNPDIIINCAALTDIEKIEKDSNNAFKVNSHGAQNIATISKKYSKKFIQISTDSVFDGKTGNYNEKDIPNPINQYSKSKLKGEQLVLKDNSDAIVVRTNFFGYNDEGNFLFNWIYKNLKEGKTIKAFDDIIFIELSLTEFKGIINLSGNQIFSKYEFIKKIAMTLDYDINLLEKCSSQKIKFLAKRPKNTTLNNTVSRKILKTEIKNLEEWLLINFEKKSIIQ
jgi:dTDP-4-dehydrorhamnose reductase